MKPSGTIRHSFRLAPTIKMGNVPRTPKGVSGLFVFLIGSVFFDLLITSSLFSLNHPVNFIDSSFRLFIFLFLSRYCPISCREVLLAYQKSVFACQRALSVGVLALTLLQKFFQTDERNPFAFAAPGESEKVAFISCAPCRCQRSSAGGGPDRFPPHRRHASRPWCRLKSSRRRRRHRARRSAAGSPACASTACSGHS